MTDPGLQMARSAAVMDGISAVTGLMPQVMMLDPARVPLARSWLLSIYLPTWATEAGVPIAGRDLSEVSRAAHEAWKAHRERARASFPPATWPSLCDEVRDVVRLMMQGSAEAAIRLPIDDPIWAMTEQQVWSTVEACVWAISWRAVAREPAAPVSASIQNALLPRRLDLQRSALPLVLGVTPKPPEPVPPQHVEDGVLFNADADVLAFMRLHLPSVKDWGPCRCLGLLRHGKIAGGVVFNNYRREVGDIMISAAFNTSAWFRPKSFRRVFAYPFVDLGCKRLTDHVPRRLKAARQFAEKAGFKLEGVKRRGFDGRQDLMMYGMLREECRFLKEA